MCDVFIQAKLRSVSMFVCDSEWCLVKPGICIGHKLDISYCSDTVITIISRRSYVFADFYVILVAAIAIIFILIPADNILKPSL